MKLFLTLLLMFCVGYWLYLIHWSVPIFFFSLLGVLYFEGEENKKKKAEEEKLKNQEGNAAKPRTGESISVKRRSIAQGRPSVHKVKEE